MQNTFVLGADIGGFHVTAAMINLKSSTILPGSLFRRNIDSHGSQEAI
jgi:glucokinase